MHTEDGNEQFHFTYVTSLSRWDSSMPRKTPLACNFSHREKWECSESALATQPGQMVPKRPTSFSPTQNSGVISTAEGLREARSTKTRAQNSLKGCRSYKPLRGLHQEAHPQAPWDASPADPTTSPSVPPMLCTPHPPPVASSLHMPPWAVSMNCCRPLTSTCRKLAWLWDWEKAPKHEHFQGTTLGKTNRRLSASSLAL